MRLRDGRQRPRAHHSGVRPSITSQLLPIASCAQSFAAEAAAPSVIHPARSAASTLPLAHNPFTPAQNRFLDELERRRLFFWEQASPRTGMVKDRALAAGRDQHVVSSIASTGFGLTGLCIAAERGFIQRPKVKAHVLATLQFLWNGLPNVHGFFITLWT